MPHRDAEVKITCTNCEKEFVLRVEAVTFNAWANGSTPIQKALPYLTADERELLISNTCGSCFDKLFGEV